MLIFGTLTNENENATPGRAIMAATASGAAGMPLNKTSAPAHIFRQRAFQKPPPASRKIGAGFQKNVWEDVSPAAGAAFKVLNSRFKVCRKGSDWNF
jgi:hypothetical protein